MGPTLRSVVDRFEHTLGRPAHHHLAGEGVDLLDLELGQSLAYPRRCGLGPPIPVLVLERLDRHDRPAGIDRLVVEDAELLHESVGELRIDLVHKLVYRAGRIL